MPDDVAALARREEAQGDRDELDDLVKAPRSRGPHEGFQLRKCQFNRIEIGTVRRQKSEPCADACNRRLHRRLFVHREVVEDDDVAWAQGRHEDLLDIREKRGIVDRAIKDGGRGEPVDA